MFLFWQYSGRLDYSQARSLIMPDSSTRTIDEIFQLRSHHAYLYEFRLTQEEFNVIRELLRMRLNTPLAIDKNDFQALFILYAADWWRRCYDGKGWRWSPLIESIGGNPDDWSSEQRKQCVEHGFDFWGITLRETGGLKYLGSIAVQGGLPVRLLAEARGNVSSLLHRVLLLAEQYPSSKDDIYTWVKNLHQQLPKSYQTDSIYYLLMQVVSTTLELKKEANLKADGNVLETLECAIPEWRQRYPIALDDDAATALLNQLVCDAANIELPQAKNNLFSVMRTLEQDGNSWHMRSLLAAPETLDSKKLESVFTMPNAAQQLQLYVQLGSQSHTTAMRKLAGHACYRLERRGWSASGDDGYAEHRLTIRDQQGQQWHAIASGGEQLDDAMPWIFVRMGAGGSTWRFLKQGGGKVASPELLIAIPDDWRHSANIVGRDRQRVFIRISTPTTMFDTENRHFHISTGQVESVEEKFEWKGVRLWDGIRSSTPVFKGIPDLFVTKVDTCSHQVSTLKWRYVDADDRQWKNSARDMIGLVEACYAGDDGSIIYSSRIILLPKNIQVIMRCANNDATSGMLLLQHWNISKVRSLTEHVQLDDSIEGADMCARIQSVTGQKPPECVEIEVMWGHSNYALRLAYPFPARGGRLFDEQGKELDSGTVLPAHRLLGIRLWGFALNHKKILWLDDGETREKFVLPLEDRIEIRPLDYEQNIQRMLSRTDIDAKVSMELDVGGNPFTVYFQRYTSSFDIDDASPRILLDAGSRQAHNVEMLKSIPLYAMRLDEPSEESERLEVATSEGVAFGGWVFDIAKHSEAPWLIYSKSNKVLSIRPLLYPCEYDEGDGSPLSQAIRVKDAEPRWLAIAQVLDDLSTNFNHQDWTMLEQLAKELDCLSLASLDVWTCLIHHPAAMAALVLRMGGFSIAFIQRFTSELPWLWEMVSATQWLLALQQLNEWCECLPETIRQSAYEKHLQERITLLRENSPSLCVLLNWLENRVKKMDLPIIPQLDDMYGEELFGDDTNSRRQKLLRNTHHVWPEHLSDIVYKAVSDDEQLRSLCYAAKMSYRSSIINLPVMLAYYAARDELPIYLLKRENMVAIRRYQRFDPEWFANAFDLTFARCIARGMVSQGDDREA